MGALFQSSQLIQRNFSVAITSFVLVTLEIGFVSNAIILIPNDDISGSAVLN